MEARAAKFVVLREKPPDRIRMARSLAKGFYGYAYAATRACVPSQAQSATAQNAQHHYDHCLIGEAMAAVQL